MQSTAYIKATLCRNYFLCDLVFSIAVPNNDTLSEITLAGPLARSLSLSVHQHPLHSVLTSVMKLVEAVESSYIAHSLSSVSGVHSICRHVKPPLIERQNTNIPRCCSAAAAVCSGQPTWCFQEPL